MPNITQYSPHSGRYIKDDGSVVNLADKIEAIYNALIVDKDAGIDVIDRAARILGKISADDAAIAALGALAAAAVTDPTASASVIALLKGLLKQLQGTGTGAVPAVVTGSLTAITHSVLTVTSTSQQALAANPDRKYAMLINDSDTVIYIKIGATAVVGEGIRINPNGGVYEMSSAIGNLRTGAINAIHGGTGTKNLLIAEGV